MSQSISELSPETINLLRENSKRLGVSIDEYLRHLLLPNEDIAFKGEEGVDDFESDMELFAEDAEYPSQYAGTYSREDIYFEHD